jgi:pimeloyl-ACP methyl ester carboxylesterase
MHILKALAATATIGLAGLIPAAAQPVHEEMFVPIGDIEQWVTINGSDCANPIILFLHGGPGDAISPYPAAFAGWEKDFTVVQWDQRGAGRSYGKSGPAIEPTMTVERMTQDGVEVAQYLIRHLHKRKVILVGGSWGSVLGALMAHDRAGLFHAYVGFAQLVNMQAAVAADYARIVELARAAGDEQASGALAAIGPPPWDSIRKWPVYRKWQRTYQAKLETAPRQPMTVSPAYASPEERKVWADADDFSFVHFFGMTLSGPLMSVDLAKLAPDFAIPVFMIQGAEDMTAPPGLARAYFDGIAAPRKASFEVPGTGHEPSVALWTLLHRILVEQVRPLASKGDL